MEKRGSEGGRGRGEGDLQICDSGWMDGDGWEGREGWTLTCAPGLNVSELSLAGVV